MPYKEIPYNNTSTNPINEFTKVQDSEIHGLGLFAKKLIPKGTIWWHARPEDVIIISKNQFLVLDKSHKSELMKDYHHGLLTYSYYERELNALIFCLDNSRYVNHSLDANSGAAPDETGFRAMALCDIQIDEEITEDYSKYTLCPWLKEYREYFDPCCW